MSGVLLEVLGVHCAEIVRIFGLVLLHIGVVDPLERVHKPDQLSVSCPQPQDLTALHSVQSGRDVAHHRHKEERHLENGVFKEMKPVHYALVPSDMIHIHK